MSFTSFSVKTRGTVDFVNITQRTAEAVHSSGITSGLCSVFVPHTTAGVTINEAADPDVVRDIIKELNAIVPFQDGYAHMEGNSAAHIKSSIIGSSVTIPVQKGSMQLGTWQGIFFCEFDGPRHRSVHITCIESK